MSASNRIILDPAIYHGKPMIRGTRRITIVIGSLAGGMLTADYIRAALRFVMEVVQQSLNPLAGIGLP